MSDREDLKTLKRAQLQQLAKKNGIPANLSSAAIIARVLEIRARRSAAVELAPSTEPQVEAAVVSPPRDEPIATHETVAPPPGDGSANLGSDERGTPDPSDAAGPASILASTTDPDAVARSLPSTPQTPYAASLAGSAQTFGTPESPASSPGTPPVPADPELIRETVAMMAAIDKMDHAYGERLARMRAATTKLQAEATELENRISSEHSRRERMKNYLVYWQNEPPRWSYEAVWSGQLKLKDLYECEEVDSEDDQDQESQLNGSPIPIQPGRTTRKRKYDPSHEDNDDDLTPAEADDEARYRPRPRVEGIDPETG
ncbi:hypothetical protein BD779DRAFT_148661 [Infundibulicybe gibba]|nr:hypothetical protein BD779DRAFT_148661 [Infundibulicybe gibba]